MHDKLTFLKVTWATSATILVTLFLIAIVIIEEPPAFIGFFFGFLSGADWILLLVLFRDYWEGY